MNILFGIDPLKTDLQRLTSWNKDNDLMEYIIYVSVWKYLGGSRHHTDKKGNLTKQRLFVLLPWPSSHERQKDKKK